MSHFSTSIQLSSTNEVYSLRSKIYDVVDLLCAEKTQPSRMASRLSSILRHNLEGNPEGVVLHITLDLNTSSVALDFLINEQQINDLQRTFVSHNNIQTAFEKAVEILGRKTKEELQRELHESTETLHRTNVEKARMEQELNVAKDIQWSMLPVQFPAFPHRKDIDIYAHLIPAKEVGGDFYDFYFLDEHHLCFTVGDVSGKGVPAALMMAVCKTLIKSRASSDKSTASILTFVNNEMAKDNKNFMFVTIFLAILHTATGELIYTNAGHNPTYIRRKNGELLKLTDLHGPVIAAMEGMTYGESKLHINTGDWVFAYTDGIPESHDKNGKQFTDARLRQWLQDVTFEGTEQIVKGIVAQVQAFETGTTQFDDITALCLEYKGDNTQEQSMTVSKLAIRNQMEEVQTAIIALETFGEANEISMPVIMKVSVVVDELLSNIVKYGFTDDKEHLIEVAMELQGGKLMLTFSDDGIPFNPFQKTPPDLTKPIEERELGGLGIHLVRELMDGFSYNREANRNVVAVVKNV